MYGYVKKYNMFNRICQRSIQCRVPIQYSSITFNDDDDVCNPSTVQINMKDKYFYIIHTNVLSLLVLLR